MGVYKWPVSVIQECSKKIRNFLSSGDCNRRKLVTIGWERVNKPKCKRELGLRQLADINHSLLTTMAWSFLQVEDNLSRFLHFKFVEKYENTIKSLQYGQA